jgi:hypothetical protein
MVKSIFYVQLCFLIILFFSNHVTSFSFYAPRYGSIIVGAILSKLTAKGDPVKTGSDSSGKRRNRRASFSFHGGMQVFLPCYFSNYNSLIEMLSSVVVLQTILMANPSIFISPINYVGAT